MRRFQSGFELYFAPWAALAASGAWGVAVAGAAARRGSFGMRVWRGAIGTSGSGYAEATFGRASDRCRTAGTSDADENTISMPQLIDIRPAVGNMECSVRFYLRIATRNQTSALHLFHLCRFLDGTTFRGSFALNNTSFFVIGASSVSLAFNPSLNVWYRIALHMKLDSSGNGSLKATVYEERTNTVLAEAQAALSVDPSFQVNTVQLGVIPAAQPAASQDFHFDDVAINDSFFADGLSAAVHKPHYPGAGATRARILPSDPGVWAEFTPTPAGRPNWDNVNDWTETADYNTTPTGGANTVRDSFGIPDYGGANTVRSVLVATYSEPNRDPVPSEGLRHYQGLYTEGRRLTHASGAGGPGAGRQFAATVVSERAGGGAWINFLFNASEAMYQRTGVNTESRFMYEIGVEVEDNDGLADPPEPPPPTGATRLRGGEF